MPSYKNDSVHGPGYLDPASKDLLDVHMSMREEPDSGADPIRVVIADQDHIFIEGVASLLKEWEEFELVGKAFSLEEAFELCSREKPAFIMMGATFRGESCAPTVKRLCDADSQLRVMVVASMGESGFVLDALRAGARGFGSRDEMSADSLRSLLWAQACGDIAFSGSLGTVLQGALLNGRPTDASDSAESSYFDSLDDRETKVLALLEEGLSNEEISQRLFLSVPTVKKAINGIIQKLHVNNRVQAAVVSARRNRR